MKASLVSILFSVALLTSCQSNSYKISGTVSSAEGLADGDTLFVTQDLQTGIPSDTLIIKDGKFEMSGETDSTTLCMIYSAIRNEINSAFFLESGSINIELTEQPGGSRVSGTICNNQWQTLNDSVMSIGKEINRIAEHIYGNNLSQEEQQKGMEQIERLNKRFADLVVKTAEKNIDNEFGYFLLTYYPEELINNEQRARLIKELPAEMRQRPAIKVLEQTIDEAAKTAEGATIQDFTQKAPDGTEISLMDEVKKHKITVIDFWASWCGPCRQEMPFMMQMYDKHQAKGLGIIGISLDNDVDAWVKGTEALGFTWPQMSDLKGWENKIAQHFQVTSIPHTIVVDQKGTILRRGLRGEELEAFVVEQLK
ncbi:MAG: AhpC/TSA family protein [Prevotella sp.]|nr:AhpC/TSA family protein [Prevotella sp.]